MATSSTKLTSGGGNQAYFSEMKKGEINELRLALRNTANEKDPAKQRAVVQRVISYMTVGLDVSGIFSEMIMLVNTRDLIQKKLVYLYLCSNAESHPDLSLLVINTLQKDCRDDNPMIRGLALRSICSLRVPNITEYVHPFIVRGLSDISPYVRKTAALGCVKLFSVSPNIDFGFSDKLFNLLRDKDTLVVTNALNALQEIGQKGGLGKDGFVLPSALVLQLLSRFREFNEWGQCDLLSLLTTHFTNTPPENEQIILDVLNLLDERLRHGNSAVVIGVVKLFFRITENLPNIHSQVFERVRTPLLTLMETGSGPENSYIILHHIYLMLHRVPTLFSVSQSQGELYKHFFCRAQDPLYVKNLKMKILTLISETQTAKEIIQELVEYVYEGDEVFGKNVIEAIGGIGMRVPDAQELVMETFLSLLHLEIDHLSVATFKSLKDFLRAYPQQARDILKDIPRYLTTIEDSEAREVIVWMIGEYANRIEDPHYLIEDILVRYDEETTNVKLLLLTTAMKVFFIRPAEMQPVLGTLFEKASHPQSPPDLHDRALFYYRLLLYNISEASRVINSFKTPLSPGTKFAESENVSKLDKIFEEFDSLSVVYGLPSDEFIPSTPIHNFNLTAFSPPISTSSPKIVSNPHSPSPSPSPSPSQPKESGLIDADINVKPLKSSLQFLPPMEMEPAKFQELWDSLITSSSFEMVLPPNVSIPSVSSIEEILSNNAGLSCLASGTVDDMMKLYHYVYLGDGNGNSEPVLLEIIIDGNGKVCAGNVKSPLYPARPDITQKIANLVKDILISLFYK